METPQITNTKPDPGPDAQLIKYARTHHVPPLSIREAARRAGISESRWRQVEKGYASVGTGEFKPAIASDLTLSAMAIAIGLDGGDLRGVNRSRAAEIIDAQQEAATAQITTQEPSLSQFTDDELLLELRARLQRVARTETEHREGATLTAVIDAEESTQPVRIAARRAPRQDPSIWDRED